MFFRKDIDPVKRELTILESKERKLIQKRTNVKESYINRLLEDKVPEKLQNTLERAFEKAFELVFTKGNIIIEKTYNKDDYMYEYENNEYIHSEQNNRKSLKQFSRKSGESKKKNMIISGIEGAGMGALGIGIPDIPVFTGVLLKSIYEIAMSYGYEYESKYERFFILKLIETAMDEGESFISNNNGINIFMESDVYVSDDDISSQIKRTAMSVSKGMLYMKFIQGIPVVGIAGGITNTIYLKKISEYADMKYKRRFLINKSR